MINSMMIWGLKSFGLSSWSSFLRHFPWIFSRFTLELFLKQIQKWKSRESLSSRLLELIGGGYNWKGTFLVEDASYRDQKLTFLETSFLVLSSCFCSMFREGVYLDCQQARDEGTFSKYKDPRQQLVDFEQLLVHLFDLFPCSKAQ